jgi:aryl carrier-like protein
MDKIHKDYIIFASDDKPFILAGKETVLCAMIVKLYESKINDLFAKRELLRTSEVRSIDMQSLESTREGIHNLICEILGLKTLGGNDDIFAAGLDSLSVFKILASLRATFQAAGKAHDDLSVVSTSTIYTNPTVEKLSNTLYKILRTGSSNAAAEDDDFMRALGEIHSDSARKTTF